MNKFYLTNDKESVIFNFERHFSYIIILDVKINGICYGKHPYYHLCLSGKKEKITYPIIHNFIGQEIPFEHKHSMTLKEPTFNELKISLHNTNDFLPKYEIEITINTNFVGVLADKYDEIYSCIKNLTEKELFAFNKFCNFKGIEKDNDFNALNDKWHWLNKNACDYFMSNDFKNMLSFCDKFHIEKESCTVNEILKFLFLMCGGKKNI